LLRYTIAMDSEKIAVFIDAGNLWSSYKELGKLLDFTKLNSFVSQKFKKPVFKIFYYVAYPKEGTREKEVLDKLHKFLTFLNKGLGFKIVKKELKTIYVRDADGQLILDKEGKIESREKGNFDVEITIDALMHQIHYDTAVFFTGDSDFLPLISYLRNLKDPKKVYIFSTKGCVSKELITGADGYFDLRDCPAIHGGNLVAKVKTIKK
jgi:uncharacterized LabA/DUF88 family protein